MRSPAREKVGCEVGGRPWPCPSAHDNQRVNAFRITHGEREASRAAPVVTHGCAREIELTDKANEIGNVAIERVGLFARRLLGKTKSDHVRNNDAPAGLHQRPDHIPVKLPQVGLPCRSRTGSPSPSST